MIKKPFLSKVKDSPSCRADLQEALGKSYATIDRYIKDNDIMLTTLAALLVIKAFTGTADIFDLVENIPTPRKSAPLATH